METKQFKAESKRLLDMMIHSIYTHKEIFLRELISNASDAIDKLYFKSLTDDKVGLNKDDFAIWITADKDTRTLKIADNGIGMTEEELENNLGTIANSGSFKFKNENKLDEDNQIIGQFGVGFYSAFMIAKKVTVISKAYGSDKAYRWESEGVDGYTITEDSKGSAGTEIILELLDDTDDENYSEFLDQYRIKSLVKKYSDYIRFPIKMEVTHSRPKDQTEEERERGQSSGIRGLHRSRNSQQHGSRSGRKTRTNSRTRTTSTSTPRSSLITASRSNMHTSRTRAMQIMTLCSISRQKLPLTITQRSTKRDSSSTQTAFSSWTSAQIFFPTISAL